MAIFTLTNSDGELKKYRSFDVKAEINDLIRIPCIPEDIGRLRPNGINAFNH